MGVINNKMKICREYLPYPLVKSGKICYNIIRYILRDERSVNSMLLKNAYVYRNQTKSFEKADIGIENGIITAVGELDGDGVTIDLEERAVVSGLIDVHTHGRAGYDFVNIPADKLGAVAADYARHGVTAVMPTVASAPLTQMIAAADGINKHKQGMGEAWLCGVHLEGRYLNIKRKGAHAEQLIADLNANELENAVFRACENLHISAALERDADGSFASKALELGATLSLGHTDATFDQAKRAEKLGATAYTHLFNAMPLLHHRDGGAICAALTGDCFAELICDGIHIAPQMIKLAYTMLGCERTVLISDSMEATGCPDGEYSIAGNPAVVKNGIALTPEGALAGSTLTLDKAVNNLLDFCGIPLTEAILCATENPAKEVGIFDVCGSVDVGKRADLLVLGSTERLLIEKTMVNGEFI